MRGCEMNKKEPQKTISLNILLVKKQAKTGTAFMQYIKQYKNVINH